MGLLQNRETYFNRKFGHKNKKNKLAQSTDENKDENKDENAKEDEKKEEEIQYEKGCFIKLFGLPESITFQEIRTALHDVATVKYVDIFPDTHTVCSKDLDLFKNFKFNFFLSFQISRESLDLLRKMIETLL